MRGKLSRTAGSGDKRSHEGRIAGGEIKGEWLKTRGRKENGPRQERSKERPCICENSRTVAQTRPPNRIQDCDETTFFRATL
jgi:hypothetical protein